MCTSTVYKQHVHLLSWVKNIKTEKIYSKLFGLSGRSINFNVHSNYPPALLWSIGWLEFSHKLELIDSWVLNSLDQN